jgi:hypothetical protein
MLKKILDLRKIKDGERRLAESKREVYRPVLTDLSLLPMLYEWFKEIPAEMPLPPNPDSVMQRKKFLFVVMMLYSPTVFCGNIAKAGLCKELSKIFGVTVASISRNMSDIVFFYENYRDYESSVEAIYEEIMNRLSLLP